MWLDKASSSLLGRGGTRPNASVFVDPGATIVLYTDGLVERRGESLDAGLARLVQAARAVAGQSDSARKLVERISSERTIGQRRRCCRRRPLPRQLSRGQSARSSWRR